MLKAGKIQRISMAYFDYSREKYFTDIRPNWKTIGKHSNIDIDNPLLELIISENE